MAGTKWTVEEENILVQLIQENPHNKAEAFRLATLKINRSEGSCSQRWYKYLSNPYSDKYVGCAFLTVGRETYLQNRTMWSDNCSVIEPAKVKSTLWSRIKRLFGF